MFDTSAVPDSIVSLVSSDFGILVLFLIALLEGAMLLYVMPSELLVPVGLLVFGTTVQDAILIVGVVASGATVGQTALFMLANRKGKEKLLSQSWFKISEQTVDKYEGWFNQWGQGLVPITNTLPIVRGLMTVPAGFSDLSTVRFAVLSAVGTIVFQVILSYLYIVGTDVLMV